MKSFRENTKGHEEGEAYIHSYTYLVQALSFLLIHDDNNNNTLF